MYIALALIILIVVLIRRPTHWGTNGQTNKEKWTCGQSGRWKRRTMPKPKVSFAICPKPLLQRGLRSHRHVISSYGRGGLSAAILGREANEVLTHTKTPLWC